MYTDVGPKKMFPLILGVREKEKWVYGSNLEIIPFTLDQ